MVVTLFLTIGVIFVLFLVVSPKQNIHKFEIIFIWMLTLFFYEVFISMLTLNYKQITLSQEIKDTWMLAVQQVIINPIVTIWCLGKVSKTKLKRTKLVIIVIFSMILTGIESLASHLNMLDYVKQWNALYSFGVIFLIVVTILFLQKWYRKILDREVHLP